MRHSVNIDSRQIIVQLDSEQPSNQSPDEAQFFATAAEKLEQVAGWLRKLNT